MSCRCHGARSGKPCRSLGPGQARRTRCWKGRRVSGLTFPQCRRKRSGHRGGCAGRTLCSRASNQEVDPPGRGCRSPHWHNARGSLRCKPLGYSNKGRRLFSLDTSFYTEDAPNGSPHRAPPSAAGVPTLCLASAHARTTAIASCNVLTCLQGRLYGRKRQSGQPQCVRSVPYFTTSITALAQLAPSPRRVGMPSRSSGRILPAHVPAGESAVPSGNRL